MRWETEASGATLRAIGEGEALTLGALSVEAMTTDDPECRAELEARKQAALEAGHSLGLAARSCRSPWAFYGRFLPQDKAEVAARILNRVWEAA